MPSHRQTVTALDAPAAIGPYSHAVKSNGLLFCSGQIPLDPSSGELVGATPAEQARQCLDNLAAVVAAAGAQLADAVQVTVYLTDMDAFAAGQRRLRGLLRGRPAGAGRDRRRGAAQGRPGRGRRGRRAV